MKDENKRSISVLIDVKMGGLSLKAEIKSPQALKTWFDHPPKEDSIVRVASVPGTRPGPCVIYWTNDANKRIEANAMVI